jgi:hypothetical protein
MKIFWRKVSSVVDIFKVAPEPPGHRLDFLYGYRGYLQVIILLQHFTSFMKLKMSDYRNTNGLATVGVAGLFILSSYFLTLQTLTVFDRVTTFRAYLLKLAQYIIRRFFRIYMVFVVFWTMAHLIPRSYGIMLGVLHPSNDTDYWDGVMIKSVGRTHCTVTIPFDMFMRSHS